MKKLYRVKIETEKTSIVFEFDAPITVDQLSRVLVNNFAFGARIKNISYCEYNNVIRW